MDIKTQLINASEKCINEEMCGFICANKDYFYFLQVKNKSPEPHKYFIIPALDFLKIKKENNLIALFHNHFSTSERESDFDKSVSENTCLPLVIYSNVTKKFNFYIPNYISCDVKEINRLKEIL